LDNELQRFFDRIAPLIEAPFQQKAPRRRGRHVEQEASNADALTVDCGWHRRYAGNARSPGRSSRSTGAG
jgi:hypothetical protein